MATRFEGPLLGRGGAVDGAPAEYVSAYNRYRTQVTTFTSGPSVSTVAAATPPPTSANLMTLEIGGAGPFGSVSIVIPSTVTNISYRGEPVARFVAGSSNNAGTQWTQGNFTGAGYLAGASAFTRVRAKTTYWCMELACNNAIANGSCAVGLMTPTTPVLDTTGAFPNAPPNGSQMFGFGLDSTGRIRAVHADTEGIFLDEQVGTFQQHVPVRLAMVSVSRGVDFDQIYQPGSRVEYYVNDELVLIGNPTVIQLFEPLTSGPGICLVRLAGAYQWHVPYWAVSGDVHGVITS